MNIYIIIYHISYVCVVHFITRCMQLYMHMLLLHFHLQLVVPVSIPSLDQLRGTGAGSKRSEQNALP
jgi:hypothetical protein